MKVIQIVSQMEAGGAQRVASLLTDGLRQRGHQAQTWFLYKKRPAFEENSFTRCFIAERPKLVGWLAMAAKLWKELRSEGPDVVVTHTHSANPFGASIAALAGVPVRLAVHHNPVETYATVARIADRMAFRSGCYSSMVTVSSGVSQSFAHHGARYKNRLHRIYNGIPANDSPSTADVRERYGIRPGDAVLVNVARLAKQKNQSILFKMLQQVPNASLLLVGDGEMRLQLHAEAEQCGVLNRVVFTGELPTLEVQTVLQQADLFLLPSAYESFCLAAVEAMQLGLPVVASDLPCLREVLGDGQMFFPLDGAVELERIVKTLLAAPERRDAMGKAGRARAGRFDIERMVGEYECLMAEELMYRARSYSAANDLHRLDALGGIPRIHD